MCDVASGPVGGFWPAPEVARIAIHNCAVRRPRCCSRSHRRHAGTRSLPILVVCPSVADHEWNRQLLAMNGTCKKRLAVQGLALSCGSKRLGVLSLALPTGRRARVRDATIRIRVDLILAPTGPTHARDSRELGDSCAAAGRQLAGRDGCRQAAGDGCRAGGGPGIVPGKAPCRSICLSGGRPMARAFGCGWRPR